MEPGFAFVYAAAALTAFATAGQLAVLRARLRRKGSRTSAEVRRTRLVGPHASKLAAVGLAVFALGAVAYALGAVVGVLAMVFGVVALGFAVSNAVGLRMVAAGAAPGDASWASRRRSAWREAALLAGAIVVAGTAILLGTRDAERLLWLVPVVACALAGFAIVRAVSPP